MTALAASLKNDGGFMRIIKIILITISSLFIASQIAAVVAYHNMDDIEKCVTLEHLKRNERAWQDTYWNSEEMLQTICEKVYSLKE